MQHVSHKALYNHTKSWFLRAFEASDLPEAEKALAARASLHWLWHTFGTRAIESGARIELVKWHLRYESLATTAGCTRPQLTRLQVEMEKALG